MRENSFQNLLGTAFGGLCHLIWPAICDSCGDYCGEGQTGFCQKCWAELNELCGGDYCKRCGKNAGAFSSFEGGCGECLGTEQHFDGIARAGIYDGMLQKLVLRFKNDHSELDKVIGELTTAAFMGAPWRNQIQIFVPVPLHWSRQLRRGYNQSLLLAKKITDKEEICGELVRIRRTRPQVLAETPTRRAANVAGAFAVRDERLIKGQIVCLVDDIKTTGATLNECAKTLKQAGAAKVYAVVATVAGQKDML